jgi:hypothetical protein
MKQITTIVFILLLTTTALYAQKTQGPYTVWVYTTTTGCGQGTLLTSNSQLQANTTYIVKVRSSNSPAAIRIDNADGFETGLNGWCPFTLRPNPSEYADDTGSINNWTITFPIRTVTGADFSSPVYMRVRETFNGSTWVNTQHITFPY